MVDVARVLLSGLEAYFRFLDNLLLRGLVGDDGLTDSERAEHAARYAARMGRTPTRSRAETERLAVLAARVETTHQQTSARPTDRPAKRPAKARRRPALPV